MAKSFSGTRAKVSLKASRVSTAFLRSLTPGLGIVLQYDCQPPAFGIYQGLRRRNILLSEFNGFPGLVRIAVKRVNAVSPFTAAHPGSAAGGDGSAGGWSVLGRPDDLGCCGGYWW